MQKLKPFSLDELEQVAAIAHGQARRAWTIKHANGRRALIWAADTRQAAAIDTQERPGEVIRAIVQNYHAQNMKPRPDDWADFIAAGGEA